MSPSERILIVDDEKTIIFALKTYFTRQGHLVDTASSYEDAIALLGEREYDVAILDVELGGGVATDGLAIAAFIRRHAPQTFVLVLTALDTEETERRAALAGVHSTIQKPARLSQVADVAFGLLRGAAVASN